MAPESPGPRFMCSGIGGGGFPIMLHRTMDIWPEAEEAGGGGPIALMFIATDEGGGGGG